MELREFRYPFESSYSFFVEGYWIKLEGFHLTIGWICLIIFALVVCFRKNSLYTKFTTLYFATFIFNNYAYSLFSVRFAEFFGILAAFTTLFGQRKKELKRLNVAHILIAIAAITIIHALLISIIYPDIDGELTQNIFRLVLILKIFVLGLVFLPFNQEFDSTANLKVLIKDIVTMGSLSCLVYLFQYIVFVSGILPYGTFIDAGFTGFPTFGSVSIERGHYAKLLVPLFPFYAFELVNHKQYQKFLLFSIISAINFSASGQIFFLCYLACLVFLYKHRFLRLRYYTMLIFCLIPITLITANIFSEQFISIFNKVDTLALQGETGGGRGVETLLQYLQQYPLGTSYGGSSLRVVGNLPEINSGIYSFIAQYSFLSVIIVLLFLYINFCVIKLSLKVRMSNLIRPLYTGIIVAIIIYCADILWFTPTIWLPLVICQSFSVILRFSQRMNNKNLLRLEQSVES